MRRKWIFFVAPPAFLLFIALGGWLVMWLWNWLMPTVFGWHQLTFWQALGLLALCRILFGGLGRGMSPHHGSRGKMAERWGRMSPEERERLRQAVRERCEGDRNTGSPAAPVQG
jgi:hypothetical protein